MRVITSEFIQVNVAVVRTDIAVTEIKSYNIDDIPAPTINLFSLLPQGTPTGGTWFSENSSVTLNGTSSIIVQFQQGFINSPILLMQMHVQQYSHLL
jgi:hypothetical protein